MGAHAVRQLGVLVHAEVHGVPTELACERGAVGAEVDGVDPARGAPAVEAGGPGADRRRHGGGDPPRQPSSGPGPHGPTHHRRPGAGESVHAPFDVVGRDRAMSVDPHEHLALGGGQGHVQARRLDAARVVEDTHPGPGRRQGPGAVHRATVGHQDLHHMRIGLCGDRVEAGRDVGLLVEGRDGDGDRGPRAGRPAPGARGHRPERRTTLRSVRPMMRRSRARP